MYIESYRPYIFQIYLYILYIQYILFIDIVNPDVSIFKQHKNQWFLLSSKIWSFWTVLWPVMNKMKFTIIACMSRFWMQNDVSLFGISNHQPILCFFLAFCAWQWFQRFVMWVNAMTAGSLILYLRPLSKLILNTDGSIVHTCYDLDTRAPELRKVIRRSQCQRLAPRHRNAGCFTCFFLHFLEGMVSWHLFAQTGVPKKPLPILRIMQVD